MLLGGGIAPLLTLNLQHELQLSGKLQAVVFFTPGDSTKQPMTGKLGGFQTQSGHKRRKFFDSAKSNTDSPCNLLTALTELPFLPVQEATHNYLRQESTCASL